MSRRPSLSGAEKLVTIALLSIVIFLASFAASFLALGAAKVMADPAAAVKPALADAQADAHGGGHGDPSKHFRFLGSPFSHYGKDAMGGPMGDGKMVDPKTGEVHAGEEAMSPPFIFMVLNFVVFLWLLAWKGGPAIRKLASDRHDEIKAALDEAAKLRDKAAAKLEELETKVKDADADIAKMVEGMRADAAADKQRILETAEQQAAQLKRDAELRIAAEIETVRAQLTREVTAAAAAATEQLLRERMTPADQTQAVTAFVAGLKKPARPEAR